MQHGLMHADGLDMAVFASPTHRGAELQELANVPLLFLVAAAVRIPDAHTVCSIMGIAKPVFCLRKQRTPICCAQKVVAAHDAMILGFANYSNV